MNAPSDTYIGGDGAAAGNAVIGSSSQLLLQMTVTAATGTLSPVAGDTFTISLIPNVNTFFSDGVTNIPYTSTSGTVTIGSTPAAVPEPATILLVGIAGLTRVSCWLLTRRRAAPTSSGRLTGCRT